MKKRRLYTLDQFISLPQDASATPEHLPRLAELLGAEIIAGPGGRILRIIDDIDLFPYSRHKDIAPHLDGDIYHHWHFVTGGDDHRYDPARFVFFDTETTGLSGGAGMVIFLCGFGFFYERCFRVVQYFLPDYPDEPLFLQSALAHIDPDTVLVTYNGKAFDWPMLSQRFTINRMAIPSPADHLDVLHPSRSLFRRLGDDCSLISLEKHVLAFDRGEDIPGYLIPSKYFDYLYDRQPGMIPEIIRHNRLDLISLALVTRHIPDFLTRPETINAAPLLEGVIRHLFRNRRHDHLIDYVGRVTPGYLEESSAVARLQYSLALKATGRIEPASRVWRQAAVSDRGDDVRPHLLELAKYQEHTEKDPEAALETVELLLSLEDASRRLAQLQHRRRRLTEKCRRIMSKKS